MNDTPKTQDDSLYRLLFWIVLAGSLLVYFWGIWAIPILSHNEARRMIVVQEMIAGHNWLLPTLNGQPYLAKPPLFYWLAGILTSLFHTTSEWVMRLPSALSAFAVTWLLYARVRDHLDRRTALFTALTLATSAQFTMFARRAEIEMLLTACCVAALVFYRDHLNKAHGNRYLCLSYAFLAFAFLTKGPVALVFFLPPIVVFGLVKKDRKALRGLLSVSGWAIFAGIALPWYLYAFFTLETQMERVISEDIVSKAFSGRDKDPVYDYLLVVLAAFAPWIAVVCYRTKKVIRHLHDQYDSAYFAAGFLVPLMVMSCFAQKHAKYILPLIPCGAVLIGIWLAELAADLRRRWHKHYGFRVMSVVGIVLAGFFVYYSLVESRIYRYRFEVLEPLAAKIRAHAVETPVYLYKDLNYQVVYYYGKPIPVVQKPELEAMIKTGQDFLLLAESSGWEDLSGAELCIIAEYKPFLKRDRAVRLLASSNLCPSS
ncbi:ArnT family glycosyltransferase [Desulfoferrobacter suflitae]|uniref:ArnT family glycosyltransferase n=1 Tax=Desulfoferrobacter suflitae TaxID=2865782 RepID=UPI0021647597|nr:glycosyltransferase family 39 protein [Desulfoferrobacter suflitae]MCK8601470.1 glycosyltransferase family 39 protein [Desulfoferrobacter suflitae]